MELIKLSIYGVDQSWYQLAAHNLLYVFLTSFFCSYLISKYEIFIKTFINQRHGCHIYTKMHIKVHILLLPWCLPTPKKNKNKKTLFLQDTDFFKCIFTKIYSFHKKITLIIYDNKNEKKLSFICTLIS